MGRHNKRAAKIAARGGATGAGIGKVITLDGEDVPLGDNLNLEELAKRAGTDKEVRLSIREPDPMRPFKNSAMRSINPAGAGMPFELGPKPLSPEALGAAAAISEVIEPLTHEQRMSVLEGVKALGLADKDPTVFSRKQTLDYVLKNEAHHSIGMVAAMPMLLAEKKGGRDWKDFEKVLANESREERVRVEHALNLGSPTATQSEANRIHAHPEVAWQAEMDGALHNEVAAMVKDPKLSLVQESAFHKILAAWTDRELMVPCMENGRPLVTPDNMSRISVTMDRLSKEAGIFLLQHDWNSAFQHATDYQSGEIELPYTLTVFECRIGGRRVVLPIVGGKDSPMMAMPHYESARGWAWLGYCDVKPDFTVDRTPRNNTLFEGLDDLIDSLLKQVRAVLIALEAEVAVTEVIRAPYKLNQKREKAGKLPLFDFHVVSLAARKRYAPRLAEPSDQPTDHHHKRRLHFVRGHWRHYVNIKTYVKWHLRGDPELGFIDKEYRL